MPGIVDRIQRSALSRDGQARTAQPEDATEGRGGEWRDDLRQLHELQRLRFHRRGTIRRCCKKRLQKITRRTCIRKQLVRQVNLERPIDSEHQLGAAQAVEPHIPVKIAIEGDSDPALHMGMQLPNQVPHEAA
jgi:hypothetical protein